MLPKNERGLYFCFWFTVLCQITLSQSPFLPQREQVATDWSLLPCYVKSLYVAITASFLFYDQLKSVQNSTSPHTWNSMALCDGDWNLAGAFPHLQSVFFFCLNVLHSMKSNLSFEVSQAYLEEWLNLGQVESNVKQWRRKKITNPWQGRPQTFQIKPVIFIGSSVSSKLGAQQVVSLSPHFPWWLPFSSVAPSSCATDRMASESSKRSQLTERESPDQWILLI